MNFGKLFIIIVGLINHTLLFSPITIATESTTKDVYLKAIENAHARAVKASSELEVRIKQCDVQKTINASKIRQLLPDIQDDPDKKKLSEVIVYLWNRVFSDCIKDKEAALLYSNRSVQLLIDRAKDAGFVINPSYVNNNPVLRDSIMALLPITLIGEVRYMTLPETTRKQFETIEELKSSFDAPKLLQDLSVLK